jgi:hypothetical protein
MLTSWNRERTQQLAASDCALAGKLTGVGDAETVRTCRWCVPPGSLH